MIGTGSARRRGVASLPLSVSTHYGVELLGEVLDVDLAQSKDAPEGFEGFWTNRREALPGVCGQARLLRRCQHVLPIKGDGQVDETMGVGQHYRLLDLRQGVIGAGVALI